MAAARLQLLGPVISAELPKVTDEDEGKVLVVVGGKWEVAISPVKNELSLAINNLVPKTLSVLPQINNDQFETSNQREMVRVYVDANGVSYYASLEQLKQLNTKTVCVDTVTDEKIKTLSDGDIILLKER